MGKNLTEINSKKEKEREELRTFHTRFIGSFDNNQISERKVNGYNRAIFY
jgi:hypothetical protein